MSQAPAVSDLSNPHAKLVISELIKHKQNAAV